MTQTEEPETPHRLIARRVKELRGARGWSAARLAEEMTAAGIRWDRSIVANFESGRRAYVTAEELIALAKALDTSPVILLLPAGANPIDEVAKVALRLIPGSFDLEIHNGPDGVTWALGGRTTRPDTPMPDAVFDDAVRSAEERLRQASDDGR